MFERVPECSGALGYNDCNVSSFVLAQDTLGIFHSCLEDQRLLKDSECQRVPRSAVYDMREGESKVRRASATLIVGHLEDQESMLQRAKGANGA